MRRERITADLYAEVLTTGDVRVERFPDGDDGQAATEAFTFSVEEYANLVDYVVRMMANSLPARSRR